MKKKSVLKKNFDFNPENWKTKREMYWSLNSQSQLNYVSDIKYFFNKILRLKRKHEFEGSIKTEKGTKQKKAKKKNK